MLPDKLNNRLIVFREATHAMRFPCNDVNTAIWGWGCYVSEVDYISSRNYTAKILEEFRDDLRNLMHGFARRFDNNTWKQARSCVILNSERSQKWEYRRARHV